MDDIVSSFMYEFEIYWNKHSKDYKSENIEITFVTDGSYGREIDRLPIADLFIQIITFTVMLVYLTFTITNKNNKNNNIRNYWINGRALIAVGSLISTISALIIGFGIGSVIFGIKFNVILLLSYYILLAVAVDDDIIIIESINRVKDELITDSYRDKNKDIKFDLILGMAMKQCGVSITLTSLSSIIAFAIGSTIDIETTHAFCVYSALCFAANYGMF